MRVEVVELPPFLRRGEGERVGGRLFFVDVEDEEGLVSFSTTSGSRRKRFKGDGQSAASRTCWTTSYLLIESVLK